MLRVRPKTTIYPANHSNKTVLTLSAALAA